MNNEPRWTSTDSSLPPEGVPVLSMDSGGNVQKLVRKGNLWFFPDYSMYVYYTPVFWRSDNEVSHMSTSRA